MLHVKERKCRDSNKGGSMLGVDLGVNSDSIKFEVALETLGQERQPLMAAISQERAKASPSTVLIRFYEARMAALDELQDALRSEDLSAVGQILDPLNRLIRT